MAARVGRVSMMVRLMLMRFVCRYNNMNTTFLCAQKKIIKIIELATKARTEVEYLIRN